MFDISLDTHMYPLMEILFLQRILLVGMTCDNKWMMIEYVHVNYYIFLKGLLNWKYV